MCLIRTIQQIKKKKKDFHFACLNLKHYNCGSPKRHFDSSQFKTNSEQIHEKGLLKIFFKTRCLYGNINIGDNSDVQFCEWDSPIHLQLQHPALDYTDAKVRLCEMRRSRAWAVQKRWTAGVQMCCPGRVSTLERPSEEWRRRWQEPDSPCKRIYVSDWKSNM